jgi:hypothetical protein
MLPATDSDTLSLPKTHAKTCVFTGKMLTTKHAKSAKVREENKILMLKS